MTTAISTARMPMRSHGLAVSTLVPMFAALSPAFFQGSSTSVTGSTVDPAGTAYCTTCLLQEVADTFGQEVADEIGASGVGIVEIEYGAADAGNHDANTIGLDTRTLDGDCQMTITEAAVGIYHEYQHVKNAVAGGTTFDPTTDGPLGGCAHADLYFDTVIALLTNMCSSTGTDKQQACSLADNDLYYGGMWAAHCAAAGGTPPSSASAANWFLERCF